MDKCSKFNFHFDFFDYNKREIIRRITFVSLACIATFSATHLHTWKERKPDEIAT
jgi:hypothetical protein